MDEYSLRWVVHNSTSTMFQCFFRSPWCIFSGTHPPAWNQGQKAMERIFLRRIQPVDPREPATVHSDHGPIPRRLRQRRDPAEEVMVHHRAIGAEGVLPSAVFCVLVGGNWPQTKYMEQVEQDLFGKKNITWTGFILVLMNQIFAENHNHRFSIVFSYMKYMAHMVVFRPTVQPDDGPKRVSLQ